MGDLKDMIKEVDKKDKFLTNLHLDSLNKEELKKKIIVRTNAIFMVGLVFFFLLCLVMALSLAGDVKHYKEMSDLKKDCTSKDFALSMADEICDNNDLGESITAKGYENFVKIECTKGDYVFYKNGPD